MSWETFWKWFLLGGLGLFFGLAVVVSIGGAFDIRALFRAMGARRDEPRDH